MGIKNSTAEYGSMAKFLHWFIFLAVLGLLLAGFFMGDIGDKALKGQIYNIHKLTGLTVLIFMLFRVTWTATNPKPQLDFQLPAWQRIAEHSVHGLLYLLLIAMPITGWLMSSYAGHPPHLYGLAKLGLPGIAKNKEIAEIWEQVHTIIAWSIVTVVSVHVLAALKHHFIDKDNVLRRMSPARCGKK